MSKTKERAAKERIQDSEIYIINAKSLLRAAERLLEYKASEDELLAIISAALANVVTAEKQLGI